MGQVAGLDQIEVSCVDILEFYRANRPELDVLSNARHFFLLVLVDSLGSATLNDFARHLGCSEGDLQVPIQTLLDAQLLEYERESNDEANGWQVRPSQAGKRLLSLLKVPYSGESLSGS